MKASSFSFSFPLFKPAWWLPGPHFQTLWGVFARRKNKKALRRERVTLPDGDFLDIDWHGESQDQVTLILHGLEGSADSHYARGLMQNLNSKLVGRIGVMHFRSCSGEINRTRRFYHSGETTDLNFILQLIQQRYRNAKLTVIGISMGGNVLLKYLGETQCTRLTKAIAVSPPPLNYWHRLRNYRAVFHAFMISIY